MAFALYLFSPFVHILFLYNLIWRDLLDTTIRHPSSPINRYLCKCELIEYQTKERDCRPTNIAILLCGSIADCGCCCWMLLFHSFHPFNFPHFPAVYVYVFSQLPPLHNVKSFAFSILSSGCFFVFFVYLIWLLLLYREMANSIIPKHYNIVGAYLYQWERYW